MLISANNGNLPLGGLQEPLGDPIPLFELVVSTRVARRATPTLGAITSATICSDCLRYSNGRTVAIAPRHRLFIQDAGCGLPRRPLLLASVHSHQGRMRAWKRDG